MFATMGKSITILREVLLVISANYELQWACTGSSW